MSKSTIVLAQKKKRGPKPTGKGKTIGVRIQPDLLSRLDSWIANQPEKLSRPEAIRRLVEMALEQHVKAAKAKKE